MEASVAVVIEDLFDFSPLFAVVGVVVLIEDELELRPPLVAATNQNPLCFHSLLRICREAEQDLTRFVNSSEQYILQCFV